MSETRFTEDHEWVRTEDGGIVVVGITDYAQEQLGELVYVELPAIGTAVSAGDNAAVIESVKAAGDVKCPVAGTITAVNEALSDSPGLVNEDPTGNGWFYKVKVDDPAALDDLMDEAAYRDHIAGLA